MNTAPCHRSTDCPHPFFGYDTVVHKTADHYVEQLTDESPIEVGDTHWLHCSILIADINFDGHGNLLGSERALSSFQRKHEYLQQTIAEMLQVFRLHACVRGVIDLEFIRDRIADCSIDVPRAPPTIGAVRQRQESKTSFGRRNSRQECSFHNSHRVEKQNHVLRRHSVLPRMQIRQNGVESQQPELDIPTEERPEMHKLRMRSPLERALRNRQLQEALTRMIARDGATIIDPHGHLTAKLVSLGLMEKEK